MKGRIDIGTQLTVPATAYLSATQICMSSSFHLEHVCLLPKGDLANTPNSYSIQPKVCDIRVIWSPLNQDWMGILTICQVVCPLPHPKLVVKRNKIASIKTHIHKREAGKTHSDHWSIVITKSCQAVIMKTPWAGSGESDLLGLWFSVMGGISLSIVIWVVPAIILCVSI